VERKTLAEWRRERDMTQWQLAVACGVTVAAIQGIESRRNEPHIGLVLKIAQALGVPVEAIDWPVKDAQTRPRGKDAPAA
jgi:DNA-binding XRE family transcriptional regulator